MCHVVFSPYGKYEIRPLPAFVNNVFDGRGKLRYLFGMETTFAKWLREAGETPASYARRTGHKYKMIRRLAGVIDSDGVGGFLSTKLLPIAAETGIPLGTLIEEAHEAALDPMLPRVYRKKAGGARG